jgi:hypothetical protein
MQESDKAYWHRYLEFYEQAFASLGSVSAILEFGIFKGDSIRWLVERFPGAAIVGCDIMPQQPSWPVAPSIRYARLDQGSVEHLRELFRQAPGPFDLVIEDGSHHPVHQRNCLVETLPFVRPGGVYVLEDIHTSHPAHAMFRSLGRPGVVGPLHLLLALEHLRATGGDLDEAVIKQLTSESLFAREDVDLVVRCAQSVGLYRRATLPHRCYQCGTAADFDFATLRCRCGTSLYEEADSISAVIHVRG